MPSPTNKFEKAIGVSWRGDGRAREPVALSLSDLLRAAIRGALITTLIAVAFPLTVVLRVFERAVCGHARPVTGWIGHVVCAASCRLLALRVSVRGESIAAPGISVANHVSWLDVFVLNAAAPMTFVAKSEVRDWPGIGVLARAMGTVFIERRRGASKSQEALLSARMTATPRLMIFPEGTSTDGHRVLPFRSTIFAGLYAATAPEGLAVQPVTLRYRAPPGRDARFYGWWMPMGFGESLLQVLAQRPQGCVEVIWHAPILTAGLDRKSLAQRAEAVVRTGLED